MGLMTATGPPPNFLMPLVTGLPLAVALARWTPERDAPARPGPFACGVLGLVSGLAVWNSSLAIPAFVGMAAGLVIAGGRLALRDRTRVAAFARRDAPGCEPSSRGAALGSLGHVGRDRGQRRDGAPAALAVGAGPARSGPRRPGPARPSGPPGRGRARAGVLAPGREPRPGRRPPLLLWLGAPSRPALPLVGWAGALLGAFVLSRRTGPDELRYLYGVNLPLLALLGAGGARLLARSRPAAVALGLAVARALGARPSPRVGGVARSRPRRRASGRCRPSAPPSKPWAGAASRVPTRACSSRAGSPSSRTSA